MQERSKDAGSPGAPTAPHRYPCPECGSPSRSIAAVIAGDTRLSYSSGTGVGVGIGSDGPGVMVGGFTGTRRESTERATSFADAKPAARAVHPTAAIVGAGVGILFTAFLLPELFTIMAERAAASADPSTRALAALAPYAGGATFVTCIGLAVCTFYKACQRPKAEALRTYAAAQARDQRRQDAYKRLRYCDNDHIVFDPDSRLKARAETDDIRQLIARIGAMGGVETLPMPKETAQPENPHKDSSHEWH